MYSIYKNMLLNMLLFIYIYMAFCIETWLLGTNCGQAVGQKSSFLIETWGHGAPRFEAVGLKVVKVLTVVDPNYKPVGIMCQSLGQSTNIVLAYDPY